MRTRVSHFFIKVVILLSDIHLKEPKTFEEQLNILKRKNIIISNEEQALEILSRINYYRLSAYGLTLKKDDKDEYKDEITFEQLIRIYDFDKKLREVFLYFLEAVEIEFRTKIAYYHAHDFGALGYENAKNFKSDRYHSLFLEKLQKGIQQSSKELFVMHHKSKYKGLFPFWVAIEVTSFGDLSLLYRNLLRETKVKVIKHLNVPPETVSSWLHTLSYIRNVCAHYGRLYGKNLIIKPSLTDVKGVEIDNNSVFSVVFILTHFLQQRDRTNFIIILRRLIKEYSNDINLNHIGFPEDWEAILC